MFVCLVPGSLVGQPASPPPPEATPQVLSPLEEAITQAAEANLQTIYPVPVFDVRVENVQLSEDGTFASAWLVAVNPETGEPVPSEPGLVFANWDGERWIVTLPGDPAWQSMLTAAPGDALLSEAQQTWLAMETAPYLPQAISQTFSGYLLPWESGKTVYLSRSLAHDASFPSGNAHFAFDFYISKTMFNIHAAKGGMVWAYKDSVPNDDHSDVNYIVLQDTSTVPTTYQLYLHLAQNSIPAGLKNVGAPVVQGQLIGVADNTGQSTGHHLHFQVQSEPYWNGYWGVSLDATFLDVDINGGRPRVTVDDPYCKATDVCQTYRSAYVSGNIVKDPPNLPRGDMTAPQQGISLQSTSLNLSGWAADDTGLASVRFKAYYDGSWKAIGPSFTTSPFSYSWNVCSSQVPDGPLSLSLEIRDLDGNYASGLPGLRHVLKQYECPPPTPACTPNSDQVAMFAGPDYSGACLTLGSGDYSGASGMGALGVNNAASILVGANVLASLYDNDDLTGRGETLAQNDSNLADNRIGADKVSSVRVRSRGNPPLTPRLTWPANGYSGFTSQDSAVLAWEDAGGATEFKVKLDGVEQPWQTAAAFHAGPLTATTHSWQVKARNTAGESAWSEARSLSITSKTITATTSNVPFSDDMEDGYNGWSNSSNWDQTDNQNHTGGGTVSWGYEPSGGDNNYDTGAPNAGQISSPPVSIPTSGAYYLRFWYLYETESAGTHWDRRWVQISANNGPFQDVLQLSDDPPNIWLQSPAINLSAYSGKTIRVRFHFETLDAQANNFKGWFIDDFSINSEAPAQCGSANEPNNTPAAALALNLNSSTQGVICPNGDLDYYKFSASAGDQVGISTQAQYTGSDLDTMLFLLDSDGSSVLASNDDQVTGSRTDSFVGYRILRSGTYYIKLRAWNHPSVGGETYTYTLNLIKGSERPSASISSPPNGTFLPPVTTIVVSAQSTSGGSQLTVDGISHVEFYWHSGDWQASEWTLLGADWVGDDGWSYDFDTSLLAEQRDIAFFIKAYDWSGSWSGAAIWGMAIDRTAPVTSLQPIPTSQKSTAIHLKWSGSDNLAGIDHYEIQVQIDSGGWQDWNSAIDPQLDEIWAVVEKGHTYGFRLRGVDRLGNTESFPVAAEATTSIPADICPTLDSYENDNTSASASSASGVSAIQEHNSCNPQTGSGSLNDVDWVKISVKAKQPLIITATPLSGGSANLLRLYAADGTTLLSQAQAPGFNQPVQLEWINTADGVVYLQLTHLDGDVAGSDVRYRLTISNAYRYFMPFVQK
jgi:hypothetical protein